jgi:hypothetical protein
VSEGLRQEAQFRVVADSNSDNMRRPTEGIHMSDDSETGTSSGKLRELQVKLAEADLALKMQELRSKTSFIGLVRSPAALIAAAAFLLPLWINFLNNRDQQTIEVRKFEGDLITKAIYQSHDETEMQTNIHNLLKLGLIKEQRAAVCQLLRLHNVTENPIYCPSP